MRIVEEAVTKFHECIEDDYLADLPLLRVRRKELGDTLSVVFDDLCATIELGLEYHYEAEREKVESSGFE